MSSCSIGKHKHGLCSVPTQTPARAHAQAQRETNFGVLKLNVDGAARRKPSPTGIGGTVRNDKGEECMFLKDMEVRDSNEAKCCRFWRP